MEGAKILSEALTVQEVATAARSLGLGAALGYAPDEVIAGLRAAGEPVDALGTASRQHSARGLEELFTKAAGSRLRQHQDLWRRLVAEARTYFALLAQGPKPPPGGQLWPVERASLAAWAEAQAISPALMLPAEALLEGPLHPYLATAGRRSPLGQLDAPEILCHLPEATPTWAAKLRSVELFALRRATWHALLAHAHRRAAARRALETLREEGRRPEDPRLAQLFEALLATLARMENQALLEPWPEHHWGLVQAMDPPRLIAREGFFGFGNPVEVVFPVATRPLFPRCSCARAVTSGGACHHIQIAGMKLLTSLTQANYEASLGPLLEALGRETASRALEIMRSEGQREVDPETTLGWRLVGPPPLSNVLPLRLPGPSARARKAKRLTVQELSEAPELLRTAQDRRAAELLETDEEISRERAGLRAQGLPRALVHRVVASLAGHPQVSYQEGRGANATAMPLDVRREELKLAWREDEDGSASWTITVGDDPTPRPDLQGALAGHLPGSVLLDLDLEAGLCRVIPVSRETRRLLERLRDRPNHIPQADRAALLEVLPALERVVPLSLPKSLAGREVRAELALIARLEPRPGPEPALELSVRVRPLVDGPALTPGQPPERVLATDADTGELLSAQRDLEAERSAAAELVRRLGLDPSLGEGFVFSSGGEAAVALVDRLADIGDVEVQWPERRWRITRHSADALKLAISDQRDWFGVSGALETPEGQVRLAALLEAARRGQRYVALDQERFLALGEALRAQLQALADLTVESKGELALAPLAPILLRDLGLPQLETSPGWRAAIERVEAASVAEPELPAGLQAELRPYQLAGYRWLSRLASWGAGAVLADDMGLGKTLQAITMLLARAAEGPALVVAPTSVGFNWARELERFAPSLKPVLLRALRPEEREPAYGRLGPGDVLITGYELLAREIERVEGITFHTLVLDEAQAVKNARTDRAQAATRVQADWRFALTGTPVENHLGELWSLFAVISPGLLGSSGQFKVRFAGPIQREGSAERRQALARLIRPFILRRTKGEVAKDLPAKTEIRLDVELSSAELRRYEEARLAAVAHLTGTVDHLPEEQQRFQVLAALTRLRQLACHPRLVDPESRLESSKLATLLELVEELREEGHRALIFSQFTRHLALVKEALEERQIRYVYLDGQTPAAERSRRVDEFQDGDATAFLLSLKAGGTGLNLTAADYVIHLDPWWNPAVEDQATDRAHRIGQTRPVTVYRLVAQGTIEEQILALHGDKRQLMSDLLEGTDVAGSLSTKELIALIRSGDDAPVRGRGEASAARSARSRAAESESDGVTPLLAAGVVTEPTSRSAPSRSAPKPAGPSNSGSSRAAPSSAAPSSAAVNGAASNGAASNGTASNGTAARPGEPPLPELLGGSPEVLRRLVAEFGEYLSHEVDEGICAERTASGYRRAVHRFALLAIDAAERRSKKARTVDGLFELHQDAVAAGTLPASDGKLGATALRRFTEFLEAWRAHDAD